jgi:hypothetical protein
MRRVKYYALTVGGPVAGFLSLLLANYLGGFWAFVALGVVEMVVCVVYVKRNEIR